ncbi:FGGY family carbohydrate kinase [Cellvibrio japonicus]|uniref:Putative glycerol kinase n=1 Tax=Cellvibrio japonicus (strain Ueda107) TaxID=498211 RepID=B3PES0_CELJU|nr:FGGY family carbohydrate kinase [Cellvibrio japonicus]ACE85687.1 putative glycerol kinase [Cellvibrio japonicus Ueda107]
MMPDSSSPLYLAIDQGGQSSRVAVFTASGELLLSESAPCTTRHYQPEASRYTHIEQDPVEILAGVRQCLARVGERLGTGVGQIRAAGFAGQGSSLLCWDRQTGEALSPVLSWQDIRGEPYLAATGLTHTQVQQRTGLRLSPHYGASKMRWCLEHLPAVTAAKAAGRLRIGPIFSYLLWHLSEGADAVDPGHAQRTLLWNLQQRDWDEFLSDRFGLDKSCLPPCYSHNSRFGGLTLAGQVIPITAATRDQGASLFAGGLPDRHTCYINMGTGAFIQRLSASLLVPDGLLVSPLWLPEARARQEAIELSSPTCYATEVPGSLGSAPLYAWEATVNGAASAIAFVQEQAGMEITPVLIQQLLERDPAANCYLLNAVGGLSAPYWRTDLHSQWGNTANGEEKVLAWLESVIFQIVVNVRLMNTSGELHEIVISGGLSRADGMCQRIANLVGVRVRRAENADATAQGMAFLAAAMPPAWRPALREEVFTPMDDPGLGARFRTWQDAMALWLA